MSTRESAYKHIYFIPRAGLVALLAVVLSVVYGVALAASVSPLVLFAAPVALLVAVLTLWRPAYAAAVLLAVEWGFLSDVLVKFHGAPSISKLLVVGLACLLLWHRFSRARVPFIYDTIIWWILAYLLITFFGLLYAGDPARTMQRVIDVAKHIVIMMVLINLLRSAKSLELAVWLLLAVGTLLGSLTIYQEVTHSYDSNFGGLARMEIGMINEELANRPRAGGTTGSPLPYGQQLLVLVPLGLWGLLYGDSILKRVAGGYAAAATLGGIGLSFSRSMYIGVVVVIVSYALYLRLSWRYLLLVVPLVGALFWVAPPELTARISTLEILMPGGNETIRDEVSFNQRSVEMMMAVNMFLDHPILGVGAGNYPTLYQQYIRKSGSPVRDHERNAHSYYLEVAAEHGVIGFIAWSGILFVTWGRLRSARQWFRAASQDRFAELATALQIGLIGYLVTALFVHGSAYPQFFWLQVSMAVALASIARRSEFAQKLV